MKKLFGLALVPVVLAALPLLASAESKPMPQQKAKVKQEQPKAAVKPQTHTGTPGTRITERIMTEYGLLGKAQWELVSRDYPEAIRRFEEVLMKEPQNVRALNGLAISLDQQGRYEEAWTRVEQALKLDPINTALYYTKARILDHMNRPEEALSSYLHFAALAPNDTAVLEAQRRADELFRQVEPTLSEARKNYFQGLHLLSLQLPEQAIPMLERAQTLEPSTFRTQVLLGRAQMELKRPEQAIPHFEAAVKADMNNPLAWYELGHTYDLVGRHDKARETWQKLMQVAPHSEAAMRLNTTWANVTSNH